MKSSIRKRALAAAAVTAAVSLSLTACGSSGSSSSSSSGGSGGFNAGFNGIANPSTHKGGTLRLGYEVDFDSMDPGNTYYVQSWDMSRLYGRSLTTFAKGAGAPKLVPDLATSLGVASDGLKTWTYHIRPGLKFSNGEPITSTDVKYAVARSNFTTVLTKGPTYFQRFLINPNNYQGPYKDSNLADFQGVTTPDATTVVFHLKQPFADFDNLVSLPQTDPVPPDADKGANGGTNYELHPVSSGPYTLSYTPGKSATLLPNPNWSQATDPNVSQLPSKITVQVDMTGADVDSDLLNGQLDMDITGLGVQPATQTKILTTPSLKSQADDPLTGFTGYLPLDSAVPPLNNLNCRQAVEYAVNKTTDLNAYGGSVGGQIATTLLPPNIPGYQASSMYATPGNNGDIAKAKAALAACGHPNGFNMEMGFRTDAKGEPQAGVAIQAALKQVGINLSLHGYPSDNYPTDQIGNQAFMTKNDMGFGTWVWGADFPTGFGFLDEILDGPAITPTSNNNISLLNDPLVNNLLTQVEAVPDATQRAAMYTQMDNEALKQAAVVPLYYQKTLLYRPKTTTNVYVNQGYGLYDFANMGVQ